jgi:hypothetical protein
MKRFLVFALVGVLSVAGGMSLAFGQSGHPQPPSKSQAKKASPPAAPGKHQPSKASPQAKKAAPTAQRPPAHPSKSPAQAKKGPAKGGNGPQRGAGSYSFDDLKRDLRKAGQEELEGLMTELPGDLEIVGGAVAGIPAGPAGPVLGAGGAAIANAPQIIKGKAEEQRATTDGLNATGRFVESWLNDLSKPQPRPKNARPPGK